MLHEDRLLERLTLFSAKLEAVLIDSHMTLAVPCMIDWQSFGPRPLWRLAFVKSSRLLTCGYSATMGI